LTDFDRLAWHCRSPFSPQAPQRNKIAGQLPTDHDVGVAIGGD